MTRPLHIFLCVLIAASKYDAFIASSSLLRKIPRYFGPALSRIGKFPVAVSSSEKLAEKVAQVKATVKMSLKFKVGAPMCMAFAIGACEM